MADERKTEAAVHEVFESAGLSPVTSISRCSGGIANHVYVVNNKYVVRLGTGSDGPSFPKTSAALAALKGRVKAPIPVFTDYSCARFPWNVMVLTLLEGELLTNIWSDLDHIQQRGFIRAIGDELQALHQQSYQGILSCDGNGDWPQRIARRLDANFREANRLGTFSPKRLATMEDMFNRHKEHLFNAPPPVLIHNDVHLGNVIVKDGDLVGLIDFDDVDIAPAEIDIWSLFWSMIEEDSAIPGSTAYEWVNEIWPGFLDVGGPRERFLIHAIYEILWDIVTPCTWQSPSEALDAANRHYTDVFERGVLDSCLA